MSCGVNPTPLCFDWCVDGTVCYAADTTIVLYHPQNATVIGASGKVHNKRINCVRWVRSKGRKGRSLSEGRKARSLVSAGVDGKVVVWKIDEEKKVEDLLVLQPLAVLDHDDFVLMADAVMMTVPGEDDNNDDEQVLVVTATTDIITTWLVSLQTGTYRRIHTTPPPDKVYIMCLCVLDVCQGGRYPVLMCAGHNAKIYIMTSRDLGVYGSNEAVCTLTGHEDWVMSLSVMREDSGDYLLASGSKDSTVRLWRLTTTTTTTTTTATTTIKEQQEQQQEEPKEQLQVKSCVFQVPMLGGEGSVCCDVLVRLEAVLAGHEGQVSEVYWAQPVYRVHMHCEGQRGNRPEQVSCLEGCRPRANEDQISGRREDLTIHM
ncbi:hypothetical protein Pcinc_031162 [Petrolisthes cinctipes]|uniref:Elongator complex protein 2 n=1 Tax=Petrolisthes cinctipes TaxID=88211 RepID=A0AAE1EWN3_PETCI|nr:hypothetical protein Pcinc_031162 [Petrolisthes cinctipes]